MLARIQLIWYNERIKENRVPDSGGARVYGASLPQINLRPQNKSEKQKKSSPKMLEKIGLLGLFLVISPKMLIKMLKFQYFYKILKK